MVNLEKLHADGLRAYEIGRLRTAARAAIVVLPVALLCALVTGERETCACLGGVLLLTAVFLRWRSKRGTESVTAGLLAGAVPLVVGLFVASLAPECANAPMISLCTAVCAATGAVSGAIIGLRAVHRRADLVSFLTASGIAVLAASMGCVGLGAAGVIGASAGLVAGGAISTWRASARSRDARLRR
jgi:pheromone shutdown protein TraB